MKKKLVTLIVQILSFLAGTCAALAACTIDFENLPLGTAVTNQYRGVTFSVQPQSCPQRLYMRIKTPEFGATSSPSRCLKIDTGCPDFSSEYPVMVFEIAQSNISFTLGDFANTYTIRAYDNSSGGALVQSFSVDTGNGVNRLIRITSASRNIRRLEIQAASGLFEAIDDLTFDADLTPPIAEISAPAFQTCDCNNSVMVLGRSCDEESYDHDELHYMRVGGADWVLVGRYTSPACAPDSPLYTWDTTGIPDGSYYLRLTVYNKCGLSSNALTVVSLDRTISSGAIRAPQSGWIVGGTSCIDGTAGADGCFDHYTVERRPASGGTFVPVNPAQAQSTAGVINDPLASWNTANNTTPDGDYVLRLTVFDTCGHASTPVLVPITVDNTPPTAFISSPVQCSKRSGVVQIFGTVTDAHLAGWTLQRSDPNIHGWATIASGSGPVINGLLANWDTTGLPPCAYALRLLASDQSKVNLDCSGSSWANQTEYLMTLDVTGDPLAQDTDGDGMPDVWETAHGFNPNNPADAALDTDNDGETNLEEYRTGTDPRNAASVLHVTSVRREGNNVRVTWTVVGGHNYRLDGATDLLGSAFNPVSPLVSVPLDGPSTTDYVIPFGANTPMRFFRVRLVL